MRGDLLEVGLGAGGHVAVDDLLGRAAAERADDPAAQVVRVVAVAVGLRALERDAERLAARDDRDLAHRVGAGLEHAEQRVAGLVVGGALALLGARAVIRRSAPSTIFSSASVKSAERHRSWSRRAAVSAASLTRLRRSAPTMPGRAWTAIAAEVDVVGQRHRARVDLEDLLRGPSWSGGLTVHAAVEAAGAQQRRVEDLGAVGRRQHDHALGAGEPVHLGEDLVERLLALVVAAERAAAAARAADRVELVDEDDRRRGLLGLLEQVAHAAGADADDHLDELRRREREERHVRLAGDGARQQRLAGARRAGQQHALRDRRRRARGSGRGSRRKSTISTSSSSASSMPATSSNVVRCVGVLVALGAASGRSRRARRRRRRRARVEHDEQPDQQQRRAEAEDQRLPERRAAVERLCALTGHVLVEQQRQQPVVAERRAARSGTSSTASRPCPAGT